MAKKKKSNAGRPKTDDRNLKKLRSVRVSDVMVEMIANETNMTLQEYLDSKIQATLLQHEIKQKDGK